MILALDCATKTGWALMKDGAVHESGVQDFSKTRGESNGAMFFRFRAWLGAMLSRKGGGAYDQIRLVIYEQSHHRGGAATEIACNLTGRVQEICTEFKIEYASVHTATLKKFATGKGNADKSLMIQKASTYIGRQPLDDNEADAIWLGLYAMAEYGPL